MTEAVLLPTRREIGEILARVAPAVPDAGEDAILWVLDAAAYLTAQTAEPEIHWDRWCQCLRLMMERHAQEADRQRGNL
jgi:hypothetical protein